jgi:hypothetical protein
MTAAPIDLCDARFRPEIARVHGLGARVLHELLAELAARRMLRTEIEAIVARYGARDPEALDTASGRGWSV